jgi:hypothetical protein
MTAATARPPVTSEPGPELRLYAGLEKPCFFLNPAQWLLFFLVFLGFVYKFAQKKEFLGFFQFQEYF